MSWLLVFFCFFIIVYFVYLLGFGLLVGKNKHLDSDKTDWYIFLNILHNFVDDELIN